MTINNDQALKYVADLRAYWATYHNHKETSAWGAIALAAIFAGPGVQTMAEITGDSTPFRWMVTFMIVAVVVITWNFLRTQFRMKAHAADVVEACDLWASIVLVADDASLKPEDFKIVYGSEETHISRTLPQYIKIKVKESEEVRKKLGDREAGYILRCSTYILLNVLVRFCSCSHMGLRVNVFMVRSGHGVPCT
jgi:hypothetical protein